MVFLHRRRCRQRLHLDDSHGGDTYDSGLMGGVGGDTHDSSSLTGGVGGYGTGGGAGAPDLHSNSSQRSQGSSGDGLSEKGPQSSVQVEEITQAQTRIRTQTRGHELQGDDGWGMTGAARSDTDSRSIISEE